MAPPELAADAPVLDIPHPFEVGLCPVIGYEANRRQFSTAAIAGSGQRLLPARTTDPSNKGSTTAPAAVTARHHQPVGFG